MRWIQSADESVAKPQVDPSGRSSIPALPGDPLAVAVEAPRRIAGEHRGEDDGPGPDGDAPGRAAASHVRPHPSRAHRVDADPFPRQFLG